ncbi:ACP phosphodiesterase [Haliea sp. E1-2-M8]|uniref:acyl carrier protein phosphodiesterase n=1 Tax=Haliea sp. E1-2-M8 TaxID=3064706 RepID=UPI00271E3FB5|nr:ACP phosphodiesterase [Haliea sp. E1-2-M8]MDO8863545.1 ACP phosphodiesterase [Haliea sp. E1-2-M8]
MWLHGMLFRSLPLSFAMNHLAHAFLSGANPRHLVGNVAGDFLKGPLDALELVPGIRRGVQQHRRIDAFVDGHPMMTELRSGFPPAQRRYAGIVLDVAFDHYLIRHWSIFASSGRRAFIDRVYTTLSAHRQLLPEPLAGYLPRLIGHDWLDRCATMEGVEATLGSIGRRLRRENPLPLAGAVIAHKDAELEAAFLAFFPEVLAFALPAPEA